MTPISRRFYAIAAIILAVIIFVAVNIAANTGLTSAKLDLTETGQFTLSDGTKHIIDKLQEPVTLRFFYSKKIAADYAQIDAYAKRVRDLLEEYAARSDGKIIVQEVDPEPFTPAEDEATANGLTGAPTDSGSPVYFGLVATNTVGDKEAVPFFTTDREPYLEYDLSSLIYRLSNPKKAKIAILSGLNLDGGGMQAMMSGGQPNMIYAQLQQSYDTQMLDPNFTAIPRDIDVLLIAQPAALNAQQSLAIDQFVMGGGRALVFVDPNSEMAAAASGGGEPSVSDLPALLKSWGVVYNPQKVLADRKLAQQVQTSNDPRNPTARYPIWLHLNADNFDHSDQVTSALQAMNLASAGALSPVKGAATTFTPLVSSSDQADLLDAAQVRATPRPQDLWNAIHPAGSPYTIAARVSGTAQSAFPQQAKIKSAKINVIVMADSDIFDDRFWVRTQDLYGKRIASPFADNAAFVLNAVENLTGSNDLISLRTRASSDRPFTVVKQMQAEAQAQYQQEADALQARLTDTEQRLHALEQGQAANGQNAKTLSPAQKDEIERFKRDLIETRAQLRDVQARLRSDIDALGSVLAFINIALVPILVALFALVLAFLRRRKRRRAGGAGMMNALKADPRRRNLAILAAIAIVSIILAALGIWHQTALMGTKTEAETVFPQLPGAVRKIARIHIVSKAHGVLDIKFNPQKGWVLPQHSNYPAGFEQLRSTVVGLAALQTIQPATSRPDWYGKIAVDAPPKGAGTLIELYDDKGATLASLIMGKEIDIGDASGAAGIFIRKPGDKQAWLARSVFEPRSDAASWLDKNVISIDRARIQEADVTPVSGEGFTVRREKPRDADFTLAPVPAGRELAYEGAADGVATAITGFAFDDVRPATDFDFSSAPRVVIRTFDGLAVTVKIVTQGPDFWAVVYAEGAPGKPDAAREARAIDAHADGWAYKLPDYKGKLFMTTLDSLLKPLAAKK